MRAQSMKRSLIKTAFLALMLVIGSASTRAETLGLIPGIAHIPGRDGGTVVEFGHYRADNLSHNGLRLHHALKNNISIYLDLGKSDVDIEGILANGQTTPGDMQPIGIGYMRKFDMSLLDRPITVRGSYHQATLKNSDALININTGGDLSVSSDVYELSIDLIYDRKLSIYGTTLQGYASVGLHRFNREIELVGVTNTPISQKRAENEPAYGLGISVPIGRGHAYFGAEYVDETNLGIGYAIGLE